MRKITLIILSTFFCFNAKAQDINFFNSPYIDHYSNVIPKTPNASAFESYENFAVDKSTGIPNVEIPIYTLSLDGVDVPISLSYHASGIKVDELASAVGLKWTLNAGGGIFRSVNGGKADEEGWLSSATSFIDTAWYNSNSIGVTATQEYLKNSDRDHDPDNFNYSFLGNSGRFIFKPKTGLSAPLIMKERLDKLTIQPTFNIASKTLEAFTVKDFFGNVYDFGLSSKENNNNISMTASNGNFSSSNTSLYKTTGWMLDKMTTKNNKLINFGYVPYQMTYQINGIGQRILVRRNHDMGSPSCGEYGPGYNYALETTSVMYNPKNQLIGYIESENTRIDFVYSDDSQLSDWKKQLDKITIKDKIMNKQKEVHFVYGKFGGDPRLQLKEVYEVGFNGARKPSYIFTYNSVSLPSKGAFSKDYWGYYNGQGTNSILVPYTTLGNLNCGPYSSQLANRAVNTAFAEAGVLNKVQYPTGGATEFTYESNTTGSTKQGGLRIKEIKNLDGENKVYNHTYYTYEGYHGLVWEEYLTHRSLGEVKVYSSDYVITGVGMNMHGYYYDKVTEKQKMSANDFLTTEHHFTDNSTLQHYSSLPLETIGFKNTDTIQKKVYGYSQSLQETIYWNQLGDLDICYNRYGEGGLSSKIAMGHNWPTNAYYRTYKRLLVRETNIDYNEVPIYQSGVLTGHEYKPSLLTKDYFYNSNLLVTREVVDGRFGPTHADYDASGVHSSTDYTFPNNYPSNAALQNLISTKNLLGLPVSAIVHNNGRKVSGQYFTYDLLGNIKESYLFNKGGETNSSNSGYVPSDYKLAVSYRHSDGKPIEVHKEDNPTVCYIWGYKKNLPIAKIENATYSQVSGFVGNLQSLSNADDSDMDEETLRTALDVMRNTLPTAMVTAYTYDPLFGITCIIDPKGRRIYYHYDDLGRLKSVIDHEGNILSEQEYHYKN